MSQVRSAQPSIRPSAPADPSDRSDLRLLLLFAAAALGIGGSLLTLSTLVEPGSPFILAALLGGLALPALALTYRDAGASGVRALLRDCVRLPRSWWWLPLAGFGLPVLAWTTAAGLGGARPLTWSMLGFYVADLVIGAIVINIWEEMAWTGFAQRRAMARWGVAGGSLLTAVFFTGIHLPLAFDGASSLSQVASNVVLIAGVATGVRLLAGRVDVWTGRSLLTVGILHSSFNATETVLYPAYDWVRIAMTIAVGVAVIAFGTRSAAAAADAAG